MPGFPAGHLFGCAQPKLISLWLRRHFPPGLAAEFDAVIAAQLQGVDNPYVPAAAAAAANAAAANAGGVAGELQPVMDDRCPACQRLKPLHRARPVLAAADRSGTAACIGARLEVSRGLQLHSSLWRVPTAAALIPMESSYCSCTHPYGEFLLQL